MSNAAEALEQSNRILEIFSVHEHFCRVAIDAYVVVDSSGRILKYNTHFTKMTKLKPRLLAKANSLNDILTFAIDDRMFSITDLLRYRTPSHFEQADGKLVADSDELKLVVGIFPFIEMDRTIGAFLLIRDITAETNLLGKYEDKATQSITDKLTGLFNRGHFDLYLPGHIEKVINLPLADSMRTISLVILDIDHFKKCNDTYGHQAGDYVISEVAAILKNSFRKGDTVCRYGGEEFVAVLPECRIDDAALMAEAVRKKIEQHHFEFSGTKIPITISLGVAEVEIGAETGKDALARADVALYHAKKTGRNRSCLQKRDGTLECRVNNLVELKATV
jgi:diguanylate cyclase (GGDEF)-like protein